MQSRDGEAKPQLKDRAYGYSVNVIEFANGLPRDVATRVITEQLLRSATSVGANIVEAQAASSKKEFTNFFVYSLKSAKESIYWLSLLRDAKRLNSPRLEYLIKETRELARILGASILTLKGRKRF